MYFYQGITPLHVIVYTSLLKFFKFDKIISMRQITFCTSALLVFGLTNFCYQASPRSEGHKVEQSTSTATKARADNLPITTDPRDLFTLSDAEKILGEPAHLVDSGSKAAGAARENSPKDSVLPIKRTASSWGSAYEANAEDKKTGRTGKLFFKIEQYPDISSAMTVYSYYKRSNETHPGFKEFNDIADEGWTGNSPVSVYMRKGNKISGIKVNKPTSKTSIDGFNEVVKRIAAAL
jgi:hypothetical protein